MDKRAAEVNEKMRTLEDNDCKKDQKMRDIEFEYKKVIKDFEGEIGDLKQKSERDAKDYDKLLRIIDEKENQINEHVRNEKKLKASIKKGE